jgi:hypothetical protein
LLINLDVFVIHKNKRKKYMPKNKIETQSAEIGDIIQWQGARDIREGRITEIIKAKQRPLYEHELTEDVPSKKTLSFLVNSNKRIYWVESVEVLKIIFNTMPFEEDIKSVKTKAIKPVSKTPKKVDIILSAKAKNSTSQKNNLKTSSKAKPAVTKQVAKPSAKTSAKQAAAVVKKLIEIKKEQPIKQAAKTVPQKTISKSKVTTRQPVIEEEFDLVKSLGAAPKSSKPNAHERPIVMLHGPVRVGLPAAFANEFPSLKEFSTGKPRYRTDTSGN